MGEFEMHVFNLNTTLLISWNADTGEDEFKC